MIGGTMSEKRAAESRNTWINSLMIICRIRANIRPSSRQLLLEGAHRQRPGRQGKERHRRHLASYRGDSGALEKEALQRGNVVARGNYPGDLADHNRHLIDRKGKAR